MNKNLFNEQVLQQVLKDGRVYPSLAKEMAKAILEEQKLTSGSDLPDEFRAIFTSDLDGQRMRIAKRNGLYICSYWGYQDVEGYDSYMFQIITPEQI